MQALKFEGANKLYGEPKNWDPERDGECYSLPVKQVEVAGGYSLMISVWKPTAEELQQLIAGHSVVLTCVGSQPPVSLDVAAIAGEPTR